MIISTGCIFLFSVLLLLAFSNFKGDKLIKTSVFNVPDAELGPPSNQVDPHTTLDREAHRTRSTFPVEVNRNTGNLVEFTETSITDHPIGEDIDNPGTGSDGSTGGEANGSGENGDVVNENTLVDPRPSPDTIFRKVEVPAEFPGGAKAWERFLRKNLDELCPSRHDAPAGTYKVEVEFVVEKDGTVKFVHANSNAGYGMEEEVIRVIYKSLKWTPALQNGNHVSSYMNQTVTFIALED